MQLVIHGHGVEITQDLFSQIEAQLLSTLERFGRRVGRVTVRLHRPADDGGTLCTCHVLVDLHPVGGLGVGEHAPGVMAAVERASERAGTAVASELTRHDRPARPVRGYSVT